MEPAGSASTRARNLEGLRIGRWVARSLLGRVRDAARQRDARSRHWLREKGTREDRVRRALSIWKGVM